MKPNNKWNELTMQQKADLMRLYVANGYTNLDSIRKHYNTFNDGGPAETQPEEKSGWQKAKEVAYDVLEFVDPTGISSYATSEGDLRQAIQSYKQGNTSLGNVLIEGVGALPLIGKLGKGVKLAKGANKLDYFVKAVDKANNVSKRIDTFQEAIPGVRKLATAVQGRTGAYTNYLANALDLSSDSRRYINYGIDAFNNFNTGKDIIDIFKPNPYNYPISIGNYVEKQPEKSTKYITNDNYLDEHAKFRLAFEEYYPKAYYDSLGKKYTVGTGLTYIIDKNGKEIPVKKGDTITEEENLRQLQMREQRAEEYARSKTKYWDLYHPELKFQILDAMFNVGNHGVWNNSPNYQSALREYEKEEGWKNPNYDLTKIFKHADWNLNNENWLGIRARMRQNPQAINPEDYDLIYNNNHIDSLRTVYTLR